MNISKTRKNKIVRLYRRYSQTCTLEIMFNRLVIIVFNLLFFFYRIGLRGVLKSKVYGWYLMSYLLWNIQRFEGLF